MSAVPARLLGPRWETHPVVRSRRVTGWLLVAASAVVPALIALAITVEMPHPSYVLVIAVLLGVAAVGALLISTRYEVTVTIVALYLGMLDGPVKLSVAGGHQTVSAARDVLIFSVVLGALLRLLTKRERITLPPLSVWVALFVATVLVEAFNPATHGIVKALGGFRQLLEWVPFFFFGYMLMRSKRRIRRFFLLVGVIALANAVVGTYQSRLTPTQLASWGPGYEQLALGSSVLGGRSFESEGVSHVRPPALGSDAGFGGGVGMIALPATLALLAGGTLRRRWPAVILCLGAMVGIATAQGRLQAVGAVIALLIYAAFMLGMRSSRQRQHSLRPLATMLGIAVLAIPAGALLVSTLGSSTFGRFNSFATGEHDDNKLPGLEDLPGQVIKRPFGIGLGSTAAAAGFGGLTKRSAIEEEHHAAASNQYNTLADEVGLLGVIAWLGYVVRLILLSLRSLRRVFDIELRGDLAAMFASFVGIVFVGVSGPTGESAALGPFFWFFGGTAAYWFLGPGRTALGAAPSARTEAAAKPVRVRTVAGALGGGGALP